MAITQQIVIPVASYVPYERPPQAETLWTAIPRGLVSFVAFVALNLKLAPDSFLLNTNFTLPPNFAYVFSDMNWSITQNRAFDWENRMNLNIQNFYRGASVSAAGMAGNYVHESATSSKDSQQRSMNLRSERGMPFPTFPIIGNPGSSGALFQHSAWNNNVTDAASAGTFDFWCAFWQFDLEQIRKYPINSPLPVQLR